MIIRINMKAILFMFIAIILASPGLACFAEPKNCEESLLYASAVSEDDPEGISVIYDTITNFYQVKKNVLQERLARWSGSYIYASSTAFINRLAVRDAPLATLCLFGTILFGTVTGIIINRRAASLNLILEKETDNFKGRAFGFIYGVPGALAWIIIMLCAIGVVLFPRITFSATFLFLLILLFRLMMVSFFNIIGFFRCIKWSRKDWDEGAHVMEASGFAPSDVYHVVIIPNYREANEVLLRTLNALAVQVRASTRLIPVLAMEEREEASREKGERLARRYSHAFCRILVTVHPAALPGELPCKAANMTYAVKQAWALVKEMGIPLGRITVSSCDADSVFHPQYFAALSRFFARDPNRHNRFWQAPLLYYNNIWQTYAPIRLMTYFAHASQLAELAMPLYVPLPISTYSLSLRLAEETGWWDPEVISEDWHAFLKIFFRKKGQISLTPIFLPTRADAIDGENIWSALRNRYHQVTRHCWGAEDVGFILTQLPCSRGTPVLKKGLRFLQVLNDHLMRSICWFILIAGSVLAASLRYADIVPPGFEPLAPLAKVLFLGGSISLVLLIAVEFVRYPPDKWFKFPGKLVSTLAAWALLPVFSLFLVTIPALKAQTMLLLGIPLSWWTTPRTVSAQSQEPSLEQL